MCHGRFFTLQRDDGECCNHEALTAAMAVLDAFLVCADASCCQRPSVYNDLRPQQNRKSRTFSPCWAIFFARLPILHGTFGYPCKTQMA